MSTTEKFKSNVEGLWKISIRAGLACKRIKPELNESGTEQVEFAEVIAQHGNMLLRVASALENVPIPNLGQRFLLQVAEKDPTARKGMSNVRNELPLLKAETESSAADPIFFYKKAFEAVKETVSVYRLALDGKQALTASAVSAKAKSVKVASRTLKKKYRQLSEATDNAYLMSFVDHLLLSAKATLEEAPVEDSEEISFLSNWAEMQALSDDKVRNIATSKDIQYLSGAVDVDAELKFAFAAIDASLKSEGDSAKPLGALMYSLTLLELAAAIVKSLKT